MGLTQATPPGGGVLVLVGTTVGSRSTIPAQGTQNAVPALLFEQIIPSKSSGVQQSIEGLQWYLVGTPELQMSLVCQQTPRTDKNTVP